MRASGLEILEHQERSLTDAEAREFYAHSQDEPYFEGLVQLMCSGPSHVLVITKSGTGNIIRAAASCYIAKPSSKSHIYYYFSYIQTASFENIKEINY